MGESSAGSYLADPTSPIPFHCASIVVTSTLRVDISDTRPIAHPFTIKNDIIIITNLALIQKSGEISLQNRFVNKRNRVNLWFLCDELTESHFSVDAPS